MTTDLLLLAGVTAAVLFLLILVLEGFLRAGYDPSYHTGSELELGERGWIQRVNFFVMGAGVFAFAVGVQRTLDSMIGRCCSASSGSAWWSPGRSFPILSAATRRTLRSTGKLT